MFSCNKCQATPFSLDPKTTTRSSCATEHGTTHEDKQRGEASDKEGDKSEHANEQEEEITKLAAKKEDNENVGASHPT
jgi:hypothetical protein